MTHLMQAFELANELIRRRDVLRKVYGNLYAGRQQPYRELLKSITAREGCTFLAAAQKVCNQALADGHEEVINPLIAAAVDLSEEREIADKIVFPR